VVLLTWPDAGWSFRSTGFLRIRIQAIARVKFRSHHRSVGPIHAIGLRRNASHPTAVVAQTPVFDWMRWLEVLAPFV